MVSYVPQQIAPAVKDTVKVKRRYVKAPALLQLQRKGNTYISEPREYQTTSLEIVARRAQCKSP